MVDNTASYRTRNKWVIDQGAIFVAYSSVTLYNFAKKSSIMGENAT